MDIQRFTADAISEATKAEFTAVFFKKKHIL